MTAAMVVPAFAEEIGGHTLFAVTVPTTSSIALNDKALVNDYVDGQLSAYSITMKQYLALTPAQQREVMSLPGRQTPFSREARRAFVPLKKTVPSTIINNLTKGQVINATTIDKYGVAIPANLTGIEEGVLPLGYKRVLIGDQYVLLNNANTVIEKTSI